MAAVVEIGDDDLADLAGYLSNTLQPNDSSRRARDAAGSDCAEEMMPFDLLHELAQRLVGYRPQINGKAERFIQTLLREWAYAAVFFNSAGRRRALCPWLRYYDRQRPHMALDGCPPITRLNNLVSLHS